MCVSVWVCCSFCTLYERQISEKAKSKAHKRLFFCSLPNRTRYMNVFTGLYLIHAFLLWKHWWELENKWCEQKKNSNRVQIFYEFSIIWYDICINQCRINQQLIWIQRKPKEKCCERKRWENVIGKTEERKKQKKNGRQFDIY